MYLSTASMESRGTKRPLTVEEAYESEKHRCKRGRKDVKSQGDGMDSPIILRGEPRSVDPNPEVTYLATVASSRPHEIRSYIHKRAVELAIARGCPHGNKMVRWTPATSAHVSTCGRLQAHVLAAIDMKVSTEYSILQKVVSHTLKST